MKQDQWTAEEYREFLRTGREPVRSASPICCQPAKPSGVSLEDDPFKRLQKNVARYTAKEMLEKRGFPGAEITFPDEKPKRNKYGNRKTVVDGLKFDSKHEAEVYQALSARLRAGELKCIWRQVRFDLGGGPNASEDSRYAYYADFVTVDQENRVTVIDAKSEATRQNRTYINKKKEVLAVWGLEIEEM